MFLGAFNCLLPQIVIILKLITLVTGKKKIYDSNLITFFNFIKSTKTSVFFLKSPSVTITKI